MDNTTLYTFLFHCPALRSVELFGSWDNFTKSYSLKLDARRGHNLWQGCFTFSNIVCDGDLDSLSPKRDGPLKMGGTYWYYYKVDGDEECHDPVELSTTVCPLLPGQRLNLLEVPINSESSAQFTRNPNDRYLNPVPPASTKPLSSPQLGVPGTEASMPSPMSLSPWTPKSATFPPTDVFMNANVVLRHVRSASASPYMPSTPLFPEFKGLKEKLTSKRSASRSRSSSETHELEIGQPVLVSSTVKDQNLIPLASYRGPPGYSPKERRSRSAPTARTLPAIRKEFSPLGSHPVDPKRDPVFAGTKAQAKRRSVRRPRSQVPSTVVESEFKLGPGRTRANSADTRRTRHYLFSNDPWLSSPRLEQASVVDFAKAGRAVPPAPLLQRPTLLAPPSDNERPTSSHGDSRPSFRLTPVDKDLPDLPRYLTPAPLFACNMASDEEVIDESVDDSVDGAVEEIEEVEEEDDVLGDLILQYEPKPSSHFSTWSSDSLAYSCPTSDDEAVLSPTFSSLSSDGGSPPRLSLRYSFAEPNDPIQTSSIGETPTDYLSPIIDDLRVSKFGPDLFNLDIQHADSAPRRQAACFGLGFQYSLPANDTTSKATITQDALHPGPDVQRDSSVSQLGRLMDDFGYLGDAVI